MKARISSNYRHNTLILFSGHEYIKNEFRPVPAGQETQAMAVEGLEVQEIPIEVAKVEAVSAPAPEETKEKSPEPKKLAPTIAEVYALCEAAGVNPGDLHLGPEIPSLAKVKAAIKKIQQSSKKESPDDLPGPE